MVRLLWAIAAGVALSVSAFAASDQFVRVDVKGILHSPSGGATSVEVNGAQYQVDFSRNPGLADFAARNDGQLVSLQGFLHQQFDRESECPRLVVAATGLNNAGPANTGYGQRPMQQYGQQPYNQQQQPQERTIIREESKPLFKAGPLEIK